MDPHYDATNAKIGTPQTPFILSYNGNTCTSVVVCVATFSLLRGLEAGGEGSVMYSLPVPFFSLYEVDLS